MVLEVAMDLTQPKLMQRIIDLGIAQGSPQFVIRTGLLMIGAAFIGLLGGVGCTVFSVTASQGFGCSLRSDLFRQIQNLSLGNLNRLETGQLITRLTNDVTQIQEGVSMALRILVRAPLLVIGSLLMAVLTCPTLSPILLIAAGILVLFLTFLMKRANPIFIRVQQRLDNVNGIVQENLTGIRVVKAFAQTDHERNRFNKASKDLMDTSILASRLLASIMPVMMIVLNLGMVAAVWFGGVRVIAGQLYVGQVVAFINYLMQMLSSLVMVGMLLAQFSRAGASAGRILEVLESKPEVQDRPHAASQPITRGEVTFDHVTFSYDGNLDTPILRDISFSARPGEVIAILGATGSGKSSLVHLIPRLYDVSQGRVLIDGIDVRELTQKALRERIGICFQETILFSGTVRENIRYGRSYITDEDIEQAAKAAAAHEFIVNLPQGYDTPIGQRGVNLSGGQRQRLAIARALAGRPKILILDDSTSAVDAVTEARIHQAVRDLMQGSTVFIIAQRISTVMSADRILVLDEGRIAAEGTHRQLIMTSPIYRDIYESQIGEETLSA